MGIIVNNVLVVMDVGEIMSIGKHGKASKYFHIRLISPKGITGMVTAKRGPVKQVVGKKKGKWVEQNIMIRKEDARVTKSRLILTDDKVRRFFKKRDIPIGCIVRRKTAGVSDYKIQKTGCRYA